MSTAHRLSFTDNLTIYHAFDQKAQLMAALNEAAAVELDLAQVADIDGAGLQLLLMAKREASRLGKDLAIVAHSTAVRDTIDFCNLTGYFGDPVIIPAREQG